jgi:hypothetical protein
MLEPGESRLDPLPLVISQFYIRNVQGGIVAIQKGDAGGPHRLRFGLVHRKWLLPESHVSAFVKAGE